MITNYEIDSAYAPCTITSTTATVTASDVARGKYFYTANPTIPYNYITTGTTAIDILKKKRYFKCEWCDSVWENAGNCKNCGAPLRMLEER